MIGTTPQNPTIDPNAPASQHRLRRAIVLSAAILQATVALGDSPRNNRRVGFDESGASFAAPSGVSASSSCTGCHQMNSLFSHPIGVPSKAGGPSHLPLESGRITCNTCHDARSGHAKGDGAQLRTSNSAGLCSECHASNDLEAAGAHAIGVARAHLSLEHGSDHESGSLQSRPLDVESHSCLGCHDGLAAGDIGTHSGTASIGRTPSPDHPIGVDYKSRQGKASSIRLVEASRLDPRIRLFDRQVGCGSCHSIYSPLSNHLVVDNLQSRLCLGCHVE